MEGNITDDQGRLRVKIVEYYNGLYTKSTTWRPQLDGSPFSALDLASATQLEQPLKKFRFSRTLQV